MGKENQNHKIIRYKTIGQFHESRGLPNPEHPLISVVDVSKLKHYDEPVNMILDYYSISLKRNFNGRFTYGQHDYDFNEGLMFFISPNQVFKVEHTEEEQLKQTGWLLLIHPDFLWKSALAKNIKQYGFFDYKVNEALFLSKKEQTIINNIILNVQQEYQRTIDHFSQRIIISQIETLLNYADRFYQRQFITRKKANDKILDQMESVLEDYFNSQHLTTSGLPSVLYVADKINVSPNYLSGLLKTLTGQSTQQHIQDKLIEKAKEKLATSELTINEIAFSLGFEHSQSFSKLFKCKTNFTPLKFRQSFN